MQFKNLTLSATAIYLTGVLVGYHIEPDFGNSLQDSNMLHIKWEQSKAELFWSIAVNNISVALINLAGGFSLGMVSLLNTFYNGAILGYACSVALDHFPVPVVLKHLLPHAIEILAIILSCSLGLYVGFHIIGKVIMGDEPVFEYKKFIFRTALTFAIILAAAVLEVTVSFSG